MRSIYSSFIISILVVAGSSCEGDGFGGEVEVPDFNFTQTATFETSLSAYSIFEGTPADLNPSQGFELLELSSALFTDYAQKQRLVKVPEGTNITKSSDGSLNFPDGTILTKTFFYYDDERDTSLGKRIIETRLEIKESGTWNIATYLWNGAQTEATLALDGLDTEVSWTNEQGVIRSTLYHVPSQNECMTCHQSNEQIFPLGPSLLNLNRSVTRNGAELNQIEHLKSVDVFDDFSLGLLPQMVDYQDVTASLSSRGRAYLAMNCAHCHNPSGWDEPANEGFDFRYETSFQNTGIFAERNEISQNVSSGEMPFIGTTVLDEEGVALLVEYLESL